MNRIASGLTLLFLSAVLLSVSEGSLAQGSGNDVVSAYRLGYKKGWEECRSTPSCVGSGSDNRSSIGTFVGTFPQYVIPFSVLDDGVDKDIAIPNDWYVTPGPSGAGVLGRIDDSGNFQPFVVEPGGGLELLPGDQAPLWTVDPAIKEIITSLPREPGGKVFVPVQPAQQ